VAGLKEQEWGAVPHEVKVKRLERLNALQKQISLKVMSAHIGNTVEVLVEGRSRTNAERRFGRTPHNRVVNFDGDAPVGALVEVRVESASQSALGGRQERVRSLPAVVIPEAPLQPETCVA
jgi:tRNA-2-methylthio-N6-dimethylallyladenosine synthase